MKFDEEVVRMVKIGDDVYFHQKDICRILERLGEGCLSLESRAKLKEALEIFGMDEE